jgi:hypothetical protein
LGNLGMYEGNATYRLNIWKPLHCHHCRHSSQARTLVAVSGKTHEGWKH